MFDVMTLDEIWTKKSYIFQRKMLDGVKSMNGPCAMCPSIKGLVYPEDVLGDDFGLNRRGIFAL